MKNKSELLNELRIDRSELNQQRSGVRKKKTFVLIASSIVLVLFGLMGGFNRIEQDTEGTNKNTNGPIGSEITTQQPAVISKSATGRELVLSAAGYVVARRVATVSSEITGRVTEIYIEEGDVVVKGESLASLDDAQATLSLQRAKANLASSKAELASASGSLAEARRVLDRQRKLFAEGFSSEASLTELKTKEGVFSSEHDRSKAALEVSELEVRQQEKGLADTLIVAPFSGVVTDLSAQVGEVVSSISVSGGSGRAGICTLVDMTSLEIEVDVNESYIARLTSDQAVIARLSAYPDWDIDAKLVAIVPTADRSKGTVRVRIGFVNLEDSLANDNYKILPEMAVNVDFFYTSGNNNQG
ncbi:MAG: HlyD family secretion protein [Arenicella sp.]|jgi:HlyD family secretion protein